MESELISYFPVFVVGIVLILVTKLVATTRPGNLPPGPPRLPLIGNLHNLVFSSDPPHRILRSLSNKYGPLMHMKLGEITTVVVSSAEAAKQVMKTHDAVFASRPSLLATEAITYGGRDIGFGKYNEHWRQLRKICTLELLSVKRVQSFKPIREAEFAKLCRSIASKSGSTINLTEEIGITSYDITTQASIGKITDEQALFVSLAKQVIELVAGFDLADMYPSIKLLSMIGGLRTRIKSLHKELDRILDNVIEEHKRSSSLSTSVVTVTSSDDDQTKNPEDLLDVLLKFLDDSQLSSITIDSVKAVLLNVFVGGIETSVTLVDWAMAEMLRHPRVLQTAQEEVRRVFDPKGCVDESSVDNLEYLKLVINEAFRLHPPVPLLIPRESREHCEIDGYQIPVKTRVLVNAWAIGRDPKYWEDPESFNPERFLKKSVDYKGHDFEFIPFGAGRRICPGMIFGLANIVLPLAMLLYHFDWVLPDQMKPEELDMTEHSGITVRRKNELHVVPIVTRPVPS